MKFLLQIYLYIYIYIELTDWNWVTVHHYRFHCDYHILYSYCVETLIFHVPTCVFSLCSVLTRCESFSSSCFLIKKSRSRCKFTIYGHFQIWIFLTVTFFSEYNLWRQNTSAVQMLPQSCCIDIAKEGAGCTKPV